MIASCCFPPLMPSRVSKRPEPTVEAPQHLCLDAAYDHDPIYGELYERGYESHVRLNAHYHKWYRPP